MFLAFINGPNATCVNVKGECPEREKALNPFFTWERNAAMDVYCQIFQENKSLEKPIKLLEPETMNRVIDDTKYIMAQNLARACNGLPSSDISRDQLLAYNIWAYLFK